MWYLAGGLVFVLAVFVFAVWKHGLWKLYVYQPKEKRATTQWKDLGPTPEGENKYTPQGMTYVDGHVIFANSWKNTKSRVYQIDPETMEIRATFDMPEEAVHTSGLAYDGEHLWAVDYISNRCYKIDLQASLESGEPVVLGSFDTGLGGTSACCILTHKGKQLLAISDFMRTSRTYVVDHNRAIDEGRMEDSIVFSYINDGFSQGLEWDGEYLYESENRYSIDIVNQMEVAVLESEGSAQKATVRQFNAPSKGVEDLAFDGKVFYTSDETTFRFYVGNLEAE